MRGLFRLTETDDTFVVRQLFGTLGEALLGQPRAAALARREIDLRSEATTVKAEKAALARELELLRAEAVTATAGRDGVTTELELLRGEAATVAAERDNVTTELAATSAKLASARSELQAVRSEFEATENAVNRAVSAVTDWTESNATRTGSPSPGSRRRSNDQVEEIRLGFEQARGRIRELEDEAVRHRNALHQAEENARLCIAHGLQFRESRSWRATAPLRQWAALGREVLRRARFWTSTGRAHALPLLASVRPSLRAQLQLIRGSGLFDQGFYLKDLMWTGSDTNIAAAWEDPLLHYLLVGGFRGGNPHPLFDSAFYLQRYPDIASAGINPLVHYLQTGWQEGRDPHPLFATAFYLRQHPDVAAAKINPLFHFASLGGQEARDPNPWFDSSFYLDADPALRHAGENPLVHYLRIGASEGRPTGALFDTGFYACSNPDVVQAGLNPLVHYITTGQSEGRLPLPVMPMPSAGDVQASIAAYDWICTRFRETEGVRVRNLDLTPRALVEVLEHALAERARDVRLPFEEAPRFRSSSRSSTASS